MSSIKQLLLEEGGNKSNAAIRKQLKTLNKTPMVQAQKSGIKKQRDNRKANYSINKHEMKKWLPQIKQSREATFNDFTTHENKVKGQSVKSIAADDEPRSALEQRILAQSTQKPKDGGESLFEQTRRIQKLKSDIFKQEMKMKRVKKIKSKLFHKLKKIRSEKEEGKLLSQLDEIDPEAAAEYRRKVEEK